MKSRVHQKPTPNPNYKPKPAAPRKVRGGIKLASPLGAFPESWAAQRWMRLIEQAAPGEALREGLGYASAGQTRRLTFEPGRVHASIQGTQYTPYETSLAVTPFTHDQAERLVASMTEQAVHAAKLLAGELTPGIEDILAPLGLRLFPGESVELKPSCTCRVGRGLPERPMLVVPGAGGGGGGGGGGTSGVGLASLRQDVGAGAATGGAEVEGDAPFEEPEAATTAPATPTGPIWCKHACCVAYLVAERLAGEPFLMFALRGLPKDELLERLRQRRAVAGSAMGGALVYQPLVPGVSDAPAKPLAECLDDFWEAGPELSRLETPLEPPVVSHPLLRRLGPSPMGGPGKFPIVGLLATCYDVISQAALREGRGDAPSDVPSTE